MSIFKTCLFFLFIFFASDQPAFAQDSIYLIKGGIIPGKITEIGIENITYLERDSFPATIPVKEVQSIRLQNGIVEKFADVPRGKPEQLAEANQNFRIDLFGKKTYVCANHAISEEYLQTVLYRRNDPAINLLIDRFGNCKKKQKKIGLMAIPFGGVALGSLVVASLWGSTTDIEFPAVITALSAGTISVGCIAGSQIYLGKRIRNNRKAIELYNKDNSLIPNTYGYITARNNGVYRVYNNLILRENDIDSIILEGKNPAIRDLVHKAKKEKRRQRVGVAVVPLAVAGHLLLLSAYSEGGSRSPAYAAGGFGCMAAATGCLIYSVNHGKRRHKHTGDAIALYNQKF